jgi:flagellar motility protein MotE (MotC chaperone)
MNRKRLHIFIYLLLAFFISASPGFAEEFALSCEDKFKEVFSSIKEKTQELRASEKRLRVEEARLQGLRAEVDARITEFIQEREGLEKALKTMKSEGEEGMRSLAKIYENMPTEEAASRIERLEERLAVEILKSMSSRVSGKVLAFVGPSKAAILTMGLERALVSRVP